MNVHTVVRVGSAVADFQWQANNYRWNVSGTKVFSLDQMLERRARIMTEVPDLVVIGLHMGHLDRRG